MFVETNNAIIYFLQCSDCNEERGVEIVEGIGEYMVREKCNKNNDKLKINK